LEREKKETKSIRTSIHNLIIEDRIVIIIIATNFPYFLFNKNGLPFALAIHCFGGSSVVNILDYI
jgi:hypothetical protein